jgi:hypothetical protein
MTWARAARSVDASADSSVNGHGFDGGHRAAGRHIDTSRAQANRDGRGTHLISKHSSHRWFVRAARVGVARVVRVARVASARVGSAPRADVPRADVPRADVPRASAPLGSVPRASAPLGTARLQMAGSSQRSGGMLVDRLYPVAGHLTEMHSVEEHPVQGAHQSATLRCAASQSARHSTVEQRRRREFGWAIRAGERRSARGSSTPR